MNTKGKIALVSALVLAGILVVAIAMAAKPTGHCKDGQDNDGDGLIDLNDPGCADKNDQSELNLNIECDDGTDNDGDSATDMSDTGCSSSTDDDETDCGDGVCEGGETSATCTADCGYPDSCADTDGGLVEWVLGTVSGYFNNNSYSDSDYCTDSTTLVEFYCGGAFAYDRAVNCTGNYTGCANGACTY